MRLIRSCVIAITMIGAVAFAQVTPGTEGRPIHDEDRLLAVTIGAPTPSGSIASPAPLGGLGPTENAPVVRELVEDWFRRLAHPAQRRLDDATHRSPESADAPTVICAMP